MSNEAAIPHMDILKTMLANLQVQLYEAFPDLYNRTEDERANLIDKLTNLVAQIAPPTNKDGQRNVEFEVMYGGILIGGVQWWLDTFAMAVPDRDKVLCPICGEPVRAGVQGPEKIPTHVGCYRAR